MEKISKKEVFIIAFRIIAALFVAYELVYFFVR